MKRRFFLFFVVAVTIVSLAELATIVLSTSPYSADKQTLWGFFLSLFFSLTGILGIVWHTVKVRFARGGSMVPILPSMRQASLVSLVVVMTLFFNSLSLFNFWDIIPLLVAAILIEFFFQAEKKAHARIEYENN